MRMLLMAASAALVLTACGPNDESSEPGVVDVERYIGTIPPGVPKDSSRLYEVRNLRGLVAYGDSLLVQVSDKDSRQLTTWQEHENNAMAALQAAVEEGSPDARRLHHARFIRLPEPGKNMDRAYYYLERDADGATVVLRSFCVGWLKLYSKDSSCFFAYRTTDGGLLEFTLDEGVLSKDRLQALEDRISRKLNVKIP